MTASNGVGRPRKPTVVKERQGTLEASRTSVAEPQWRPASAEPPVWLKGDGLAEWKRLVPELLNQGLFPVTAYSLVAGICQQWGRWRESETHLADDGKVVIASTGYESPSAWIAIGNKAWSEYVAACGRFGLDPASAGKVTARPATGPDTAALEQKRAERRASR